MSDEKNKIRASFGTMTVEVVGDDLDEAEEKLDTTLDRIMDTLEEMEEMQDDEEDGKSSSATFG